MPWSKRAGFTAHLIVTLPVLTYLTWEGLYLWLYYDESPDHRDRLLGEHAHSQHLTEFVVGMMMIWDIPTSFLTRELRNPAMIMHHIAMFMTGAVASGCISGGQPLMAYYASFYFGAIELSSLPLLVVDIFHPKHKDWNAYLTRDGSPKWLASANEVARVSFAVLFILVRTLWFPYVSVFGVLYDVIKLRRDEGQRRVAEEEGDPDATTLSAPVPQDVMVGLYVMASLNIFFSCLQMYWGRLIFKQIVKALSGKDSGKDKKKEK